MIMQYIKPDVSTICIALAKFGCHFISCRGKGKRYVLPNSRVMMHQPLGGTKGQAVDIEIHAKRFCALGVPE